MSEWKVIHKVSGKISVILRFVSYDAACLWLATFDCAGRYTLERV